MKPETTSFLLDRFADLLSYPGSEYLSVIDTCLDRLRNEPFEAAEELIGFKNGLRNLPDEKIEELYTITFDMQPVCYPYAGYQLFGESYKRGAFMAQLNEAYRAFGYSAGEELPDHLPVILRFLGLDASHRQAEFCQTLLVEGLLPAIEKMLKAFAESQNPYVRLLNALQIVLTNSPEKELSHA